MNLLVSIGLIFSLATNAGLSVFRPMASLFQQNANSSKNQPFLQQSYVAQPKPKANFKKFNTDASSAEVYDTNSGIKLLQKDADTQRPIASITKLMTALVIMESHKPNEVVTVGELPILGPEDQKIGLSEGEEITVGELLKALLIYSGNDAANALAIYDSGSIGAFANKMNDKAKQWGLNNTKFVEPSGLNSSDLSSASDLVKIASILMKPSKK